MVQCKQRYHRNTMKDSQGVDDNNVFWVFEAQFWIPTGIGSNECNEWDTDSKLWRCGGVPDQGLEEHTGRRWNKQRHTSTQKHHHYHLKKWMAIKQREKKALLTFQEVPCMGSVIALLQTQML